MKPEPIVMKVFFEFSGPSDSESQKKVVDMLQEALDAPAKPEKIGNPKTDALPSSLPTVGRIVHYLTSEEETYVPQAAIVTSVWKDDVVDLVVFDRANGPKIRQTVPFGYGRGCWQWPQRV